MDKSAVVRPNVPRTKLLELIAALASKEIFLPVGLYLNVLQLLRYQVVRKEINGFRISERDRSLVDALQEFVRKATDLTINGRLLLWCWGGRDCCYVCLCRKTRYAATLKVHSSIHFFDHVEDAFHVICRLWADVVPVKGPAVSLLTINPDNLIVWDFLNKCHYRTI